jgi:hypothetical protein
MKKGIVIVMSMVVKKVALKSKFSRRQRNACPRCYETHVGVMPDDGWLRWYAYNSNPYFLVRPLTLTIDNCSRRCTKRFSCGERTFTTPRPPQEGESVADFRNLHVEFVERVRELF